MRRAARTDANQAQIMRALRAIGCKVKDTSRLGDGFPDLVVGYRGRLTLMEVKDGSKPPSERKLTPDQEKFHAEWAGLPVYVVENEDAAITAASDSGPKEP